MPQKPWRQLAFVLGEAGLTLFSSGVLFVIISRTSGPELLGAYALALAWLMLFQGVSSFGIPEFVLREAGAHGRGAVEPVVHAMFLGLGSSLVAIGLMLITARLLGYSDYLQKVISLASLALIPAFLNTACRSVYVAQRQMHLPFLAVLVEVTIVMSGSLYFLLSGYGAIALVATLVVAKLASSSISVTILFWRVFPAPPPLDPQVLMRTARTILTFGIGNVVGMLTMRVNLIIVSVWADIVTVGHYAAATKILEVGLIVPYMFSQLLLTRVAYSFIAKGNRDPNRFGAWYEILFAYAVPVCVGTWVFAQPILELLFGKPFGDAAWLLRVLMFYMLIEIADTVMSVLLKAAHRQREDVACLSFNLFSNIALSLALAPMLGSIGAAIGRAVGGFASAISRYVLIAKILTRVNWFHFALKPGLISVAAGAVCYSLLDVEPPIWLMVFYGVGVALLLQASSSFSIATIKDIMSFPTGPD